jgi:hypothetical protein
LTCQALRLARRALRAARGAQQLELEPACGEQGCQDDKPVVQGKPGLVKAHGQIDGFHQHADLHERQQACHGGKPAGFLRRWAGSGLLSASCQPEENAQGDGAQNQGQHQFAQQAGNGCAAQGQEKAHDLGHGFEPCRKGLADAQQHGSLPSASVRFGRPCAAAG